MSEEVVIPKLATSAIIGTGEAIPQGRQVVSPDLAELFQLMLEGGAKKINSAMPGIVKSFDSSKQTVTVQIAISQRIGDKTQTYPLLVDCPILILSGGPARMTMPIAAGDPCLVLFCDRDIDNWFSGQDHTVPPQTERIHDLSDGIALIGIRSQATFLSDYNGSDAEIRLGDSIMAVRPGSAELNFKTQKAIVDNTKAQIESAVANVTADATGAKMEAGAATVATDLSTGKVEISGAISTLKIGLDSLITALTSWVDTNGDVPNPATVAAITAAKVLIDGVLK